jgi:hypothetical protein
VTEFRAFVQSARRYIEITAGDPMIHRSVVQAVNGLREFLQVERKLIPGDILFEADRLECSWLATIPASTAMSRPPYSPTRVKPFPPAAINKPVATLREYSALAMPSPALFQ